MSADCQATLQVDLWVSSAPGEWVLLLWILMRKVKIFLPWSIFGASQPSSVLELKISSVEGKLQGVCKFFRFIVHSRSRLE